ncbi:MAG: hypothetical protein F6J93_13285 [Oscillatoria sp. SIO1A7]|nr:hypothetical protein [Oscillatoria sp. SIO1A7]
MDCLFLFLILANDWGLEKRLLPDRAYRGYSSQQSAASSQQSAKVLPS